MTNCDICNIKVDERQLFDRINYRYFLCINCDDNYTDKELLEL